MSKIQLPWSNTIREAIRGNERCSLELSAIPFYRMGSVNKGGLIDHSECCLNVLRRKLADALAQEAEDKRLAWRVRR